VFISRAVVLAGGWWVLSDGEPSGLGFGLASVALASWASARLPDVAAPRWSLPGLLRFALGFMGLSILAGVDVARLAFSFRRSPRPALVTYTLRLPTGAARNLFLGALSLMPGTLVAMVEGRELVVHVLVDEREVIVRALERLEESVARALGQPLESRLDA
jgi:multicomponent Na+:H+ antiporter subunit E